MLVEPWRGPADGVAMTHRAAEAPAEPIAIIGMACRFPGSPDLEAFWRLLTEGRQATTEAPEDRRIGASDQGADGRQFGGFLSDVADFDAAYFGISASEAASMDPHQRLMLELGVHAVEDAGINLDRLRGQLAGVFIGAISQDWVSVLQATPARVDDPFAFTGVQRGLIANRISYALGVQGPSLTVDTGQSSSLVAVHLACESLRRGETTLAFAGGVHLNLSPDSAARASDLGVLSPDGRCYTFDSRANGFVRGEGGAVILLKPLDAALRDHDFVYGVVRGSAVNNDGSSTSLVTPSSDAQRIVIENAHRCAGIAAANVDYVELHGTGTPLGDQIEATALGAVFAAGRPSGAPLAVGSVKTNVGHLEGAAGIAGLIKAALIVSRGQLVPSLNYQSSDVRVPVGRLGLHVQTESAPWPTTGRLRLAGVSSFGIGGTNCHVVIGEADRAALGTELGRSAESQIPPRVQVWPLSGATPAALRDVARQLHSHLGRDPRPPAADVGITLTTRKRLTHRAVVVGVDDDQLMAGLRGVFEQHEDVEIAAGQARPGRRVAFVFPGQGAQWHGMGARLMAECPAFAAEMDNCDRALAPYTGWSVRDLLAGQKPALSERPEFVQPMLFAVMSSLAAAWRSFGVEPVAVVGHSQGEIAAAYVAGALTLAQAAAVVAKRSALVGRMSGTHGMASMALGSDDTADYLVRWQGRLSVAVCNGPQSTVVAGDIEALDEMLAACEVDQLRARRLAVDYASHSSQVDQIAPDVHRALEGLTPQASRVPFVSTVIGDVIDTNGLTAEYWVRNLRQPVQFEAAVRTMLASGIDAFVEISPHPVLTGPVEDIVESTSATSDVVVGGSIRRDDGGVARLLLSIGQMFAAGVDVDWSAVYSGTDAKQLRLPGYAFQRRRYWPGDGDPSGQDPAEPASIRFGHEGEAITLVRSVAASILGHHDPAAVDVEIPFRDLGFTSALVLDLRSRLQTRTGLKLPAGVAYSYPTPAALGRHLLDRAGQVAEELPVGSMTGTATRRVDATATEGAEPIAIVGMACRYPGGVASPEDLWDLVDHRRDVIGEFPSDRDWPLDIFDPEPGTPGRSYVREGGFIDGAGDFDPGFFGISPREALAMDPQQRVLLDITWDAFERSGLPLQALKGTGTGVFIGAMPSGYGPSMGESAGATEGYVLTGSAPSVLSGRLSYTFGFEGPAVTVDTACSSSLVALHLAVQSLRSGECSMALAGGVTVIADPGIFVEFSQQRGLAPDGRCKAFSADADGTSWSEGAGVVILERLSEAERRNHRVLAVIRGTAINQDGSSNGLTAPNGTAQERVIRQALDASGLAAADIDVVEAHGTGTRLGDPIEIAALLSAYGQDRPSGRPLRLGSLKSNIGHSQAAAGVGGVIKMVMALRREVLPATLHAETPTPHVDWSTGRVSLLTEACAWPATAGTRRAGVSSFGISGTNAHVIIEAAPPAAVTAVDRPAATARPTGPSAGADSTAGGLPCRLAIPVSAPSDTTLAAYASRLVSAVRAQPDIDVAIVAGTLARRSSLGRRAVVLAADKDELVAGLDALAGGHSHHCVRTAQHKGQLAFLFAGQGSQRVGMGRELYAAVPEFAAALDRACSYFDPHLSHPLRDVMFHGIDADDGAPLLDRTDFAQAALFAFETAVFAVLTDWGLRPDVVMGHSVGEFAAAAAAGVFTMADAAALVAARGSLMQALPGGGAMSSVQATEAEVLTHLEGASGRVSIAAVNGRNSVVLSGDADAVGRLTAHWAGLGRRTTALRVSHAFHSPAMEPMLLQFAEVAARIPYSPPRIPVVSNLTGRSTAPDDMCSPDYWVRHVREPVRFGEGMRTIVEGGAGAVIELGPSGALTAMGRAVARDMPADIDFACVLRPDRSERDTMTEAAAVAYARGADIHWERTQPAGPTTQIDLPTPTLDRQRMWLTRPDRRTPDLASAGLDGGDHPLIAAVVDLPEDDGLVLSARLGLDNAPWLSDHALFGTVVLPGAAFVELAIQAGSRRGCPELSELVQEQPLIIPGDGSQDIRVSLSGPDADHRRSVAVHARLADVPGEKWVRHARGVMAPPEPDRGSPPLPEPSPAAGSEDIDLGSLYEFLADRGYQYGHSFRSLRGVFRADGHFLAQVGLNSYKASATTSFGLHPALLDAALQVLLPDWLAMADPDLLLLPAAWHGVRIHRPGATPVMVRVQPAVRTESVPTGSIPEGTTASLAMTDAEGQLVASVDSVEFRPIPARQLRRRLGGMLDDTFVLNWVPVAVSPSHDQPPLDMAILGIDRLGVGAALRSAGIELKEVPDLHALDHAVGGGSAPRTAVFCVGGQGCAATDVAAECERALAVVQEWMTDDRLAASSLVAVSRGAVDLGEAGPRIDPAASAAWGLLRAAQRERPGRLRLVELGAAPASGRGILDALATGREEIAIHAGKLNIPELDHPGPQPSPESARPWDPDGTVLITGGTGALGAVLAEHLVRRHGVRHLMLLSRRGRATNGTPELTARLRRLGAQVSVVAADASDRRVLAAALGEVPKEHPLTAVVHAAGIVDDCTIGSLTPRRLRRVLKAKVDAALHLHELTAESDLSGFVLFSSIAGLMGSAGQGAYCAANSFLDALATQRSADGKPGLSLAWGPWDSADGMAGRLAKADAARWSRSSLIPLPEEHALARFGEAVTAGRAVGAPLRVRTLDGSADSPDSADRHQVPALLAKIVHGTSSTAAPWPAAGSTGAGPSDLRRTLSSGRDTHRLDTLRDLVKTAAAVALGLSDSKSILDDGDLWDMGIDSLTALELHRSLEMATGLGIGSSVVFEHRTTSALAAHLDSLLR